MNRHARQVIVIGGTDGTAGVPGTKVTQYDYSALLEDVLGVEGLGFTHVEELPDLPVSLSLPSCASYKHGADQVSVVWYNKVKTRDRVMQVLVVVGGKIDDGEGGYEFSEATYTLKIGDSAWTDSTIANAQSPRSPLGSFVFNNAITVENK